jgi:hypothetical protein
MPRFPEKETDIIALAEPLWRGLLSNRPVYPKPPIHPIALRMKSLVYKNRCEVLLTKKARADLSGLHFLFMTIKFEVNLFEANPARSIRYNLTEFLLLSRKLQKDNPVHR